MNNQDFSGHPRLSLCQNMQFCRTKKMKFIREPKSPPKTPRSPPTTPHIWLVSPFRSSVQSPMSVNLTNGEDIDAETAISSPSVSFTKKKLDLTHQTPQWYQNDQPTTRRLPSLYMGLKSRMGTHKKPDAKQIQEVKVSSPILSEDDFIGRLFCSFIV